MGMVQDVRLRSMTAGLGGIASFHYLPDELRGAYGGASRSYMLFVRLVLSGPSIDDTSRRPANP